MQEATCEAELQIFASYKTNVTFFYTSAEVCYGLFLKS